jgi:hypothetical protein
MRHTCLRGEMVTLVLLGSVSVAKGEPIQINFQGTVGTSFGTTPPAEISPTEPVIRRSGYR